MRTLLLTFALLSCDAHNSRDSLQQICLIRQNGVLVEKRYLNSEGKPISIITYEEDEKTPMDSVAFNSHLNVTPYTYNNGHYSPSDLLLVKDFYTKIYFSDNKCKILKSLSHRFLIEDVIANICYIENSILTDGTEVSMKSVTTKDLRGVKVSYLSINATFNDLPEIFQSYFYNKTLRSFSINIEDGYLKEEKYNFENGNASRHFIYEDGILKESKLEIRYANNSKIIFEIIRTYELK